MSKRLYTGFSFFEFIKTLLLRLACTFGLIYSLAHYDENPIVIIIVSLLCLLFILILGDDQIIIYQDKIIQTTNSFASLIFRSKDKSIDISKIKSAYLQPFVKPDPAEIGVAVLLALVLPRDSSNRDKAQPIFFELKSGEILTFNTNLENKKMKQIVEIVNSLTKKTATNN
jgi:hypothetical protein